VQYLTHVKDIPTEEARNAELLVFQRKFKQAEAILLQARLIYRAIKLNMRLFLWERALEIALKYQVHIDTVIAYRSKYLETCNLQETSQLFEQYANVRNVFAFA